jgi:uncharacterized protein (TIGR02996 family)
MDEDAAFLRAIMAAPEEVAPKLIYADWLDERGRAEEAAYLRAEFGPEPSPGGAWPGLDPGWRAFMDTLARPFLPYTQAYDEFPIPPADMPFRGTIGRRGGLYTFEPHFATYAAYDDSTLADLRLLGELGPGECCYGASSRRRFPFACECVGGGPLTGAGVLDALGARIFRSDHIADLGRAEIPYPGYQPGTNNDEVHTEFAGQGLFEHDESGPDDGAHGLLRRHVRGPMWYVLLHPTKHRNGDWEYAANVMLFAVGLSPSGRRLVGVVTSQVCHNLCD